LSLLRAATTLPTVRLKVRKRPSRDDGLCRVSGIGKHRSDEKNSHPQRLTKLGVSEISYCVLAPFDRSSVRFLESEAQRLDEQGKGR
jgi:hypothetical protein